MSRGGWLRARPPAHTVPLRGKRKEVIKKRRSTWRGLSRASSRRPTATTADGDSAGATFGVTFTATGTQRGRDAAQLDAPHTTRHDTAPRRIASHRTHRTHRTATRRGNGRPRRRPATSPCAVRGSDHVAIHVNIDYSRENGAPAIRALRGSLPRDNKGTLITLTARVDGRAGRGRR